MKSNAFANEVIEEGILETGQSRPEVVRIVVDLISAEFSKKISSMGLGSEKESFDAIWLESKNSILIRYRGKVVECLLDIDKLENQGKISFYFHGASPELTKDFETAYKTWPKRPVSTDIMSPTKSTKFLN